MSDSDYQSLSQDMVFDLLSNSRRRFVLHYLKQADGPVRLSELAAEIAAIENEVAVDELTSQQRKRTYVSLYQTHIPKLQDAGAVSYDAETGMVELAEGAGEIGEYFQQQRSSQQWQYYYLLLAGVGFTLYVVAGLIGVSTGVQFLLGVAVLVAFGVVAAAHYVSMRRERTELPANLIEQE
jgi:Flp pilus assembly protein TadB